MSDEIYTTTGLARLSGLSAATIGAYAKRGLLVHSVLSNGTRVFRREMAARAIELAREAIKRRGFAQRGKATE